MAAVQAEAVPGDVAANVRYAAELNARAAAAGARLVVFPEAFVTGYDAEVLRGPLPSLGELVWCEPMQEVVDAWDVVVILNSAFDRGDRRPLTDLVIAPGRRPSALYDKQHLDGDERSVFVAGESGATVVVDGVEVALSVCYDASFPEHAADASGAHAYVNSGAWFPGGGHRRDVHLAARALDNGMYVVFAGLVGAPSDFIGGSGVFDPLGRRIASVDEKEGLAIADIDPAIVAAVRETQRMHGERRASSAERARHLVS